MSNLDRIIGQLEGVAHSIQGDSRYASKFLFRVILDLEEIKEDIEPKPETRPLIEGSRAAQPVTQVRQQTIANDKLKTPETKTPFPELLESVVKAKPRGWKKDVVTELLREGRTVSEIVKRTGISNGYVYKLSTEIDLEPETTKKVNNVVDVSKWSFCQWHDCPYPNQAYAPQKMKKHTIDGTEVLFCTENCARAYFKENEMEYTED